MPFSVFLCYFPCALPFFEFDPVHTITSRHACFPDKSLAICCRERFVQLSTHTTTEVNLILIETLFDAMNKVNEVNLLQTLQYDSLGTYFFVFNSLDIQFNVKIDATVLLFADMWPNLGTNTHHASGTHTCKAFPANK